MHTLSASQQVLIFAWWFALGVSVLIYIALDGADLGAGIFSLFVRDHDERGAIMAAMAGTWDANETWLIVAGGILFGTFPYVYGSAFNYLMVPLAFVLWGIMARAVALEFRHLASPFWQRFSDGVFGVASLTVTFFGGMSVGAVLHGYPMTEEAGRVPTYVGGAFAFITPFSIWVGIASTIAMTLAGLLFVRARFEKDEPIRQDAAKWTATIFYLAIAAVAVTTAWSALIFPWAANRWFGPGIWIWGILFIVSLFAIIQMRRATHQDRDLAAVLWFNGAAVIMGLGMLATMFPYLIPGTWTIWDAASPEVSITTFTLTMGGFIPVMIMYNAYQIWVFRARVTKLAAHAH
ncbi:cytochrome d ubiquinol oxidase subunit II [Salinicola avicenniae]|uniref:cytochrome d ubiquinol oxidase subunit II n=1 Tax=Salinicola avicenniae TaxID=2916836 RepID=UPI002073AED5|nr:MULTISPECIES: cytochrome d ubiquinol oxidase subunit II [unclassified Salinicola]